MLKVLELFGGIGAFSKALERQEVEHEIVDYVEIDEPAVKSFNAIHGTNFAPQDITKWDKDIEVDVIMHGSPCQDFSANGKGAGGDEGSGTRSSLMYETLRIVKKLKPKYVIWENVPNMLSTKHRHNFERYCDEMYQMGYRNKAQVLNAMDFGVPQSRKRVYTVSILGGPEMATTQPTDSTKRMKDIVEDDVDPWYWLSDVKMAKISQWKARQKPFEKVLGLESVAPTITTRGAGEDHSGMVTYCKNLKHTTSMQYKVCQMAIDKGFVKPGDIIDHTYSNSRLKEMSDGHIRKMNKQNPDVYPTLTTRADSMRYCTDDPGLCIRKITPLEVWRLMGFDDEDFMKAVNAGTTRAQLYKQAGNSIVVNVLEEIVKQLFKGGQDLV